MKPPRSLALIIGSVGACVVMPAATHVAPVAAGPTQSDRCPRAWSPPLELRTVDGRWFTIHSPQIAQSGEGTVLLAERALLSVRRGDTALVVDSSPVGALLRSDLIATPIASPVPQHRMLSPRAAADDSGVVHVVWGESDDSTSDWPRATRIRYARLSSGGTWSAPETVMESEVLNWRPFLHSSLLSDARQLFVAVPESRPLVDAHILVLKRSGGRWSSTSVPVAVAAVYAELAALPGGQLVLAYVHAARGLGRDRNSVFVTVSRDEGRTWSAAAHVHRGGRNAAYDPRLAVGEGSDVVLIWAQDDESRPGNDSLVAIASADGGATWGPPSAAAVSGGVPGTIAVAKAAQPDVVFAGSNGLTLRHFIWREGRWAECAMDRRDGSFGYALAAIGRQKILVWSEGLRAPVRGSAQPTLVSKY